MPTFGRYEATRELEMTALGSVWAAKLEGSPRPFIVKSYRPDPIVMRPEEVERATASFLERAELQRKTITASGQRWAPIHEVGTFPEGAYYVTNPYSLSAEKLIGRNARLDAHSLYSVIGGVVRGLMELKKACGRPHGNLKASNVLLERSKPTAPPRVYLSDMADAGRVSEEGSEANDIDALGQLLFQLVMHRAWLGMDSWPIPPSPEWAALGTKADRWRELCNLLLHPSPAQGLRQVDALPKLIAALKPKGRGSWLKRLTIFALLVGGAGAGGFFYLQAHPEMARAMLIRLRVALNLKPTSQPTTRGGPDTLATIVDPATHSNNVGPDAHSTTAPATRSIVGTTGSVAATSPVTRPIAIATQPATRSTTEPATGIAAATSRPTTQPIEVATTQPSTTTQPTTRVASTQIAATQPTTRLAATGPATVATTQLASTHPATQTATTRLATTHDSTTQIATTQVAATRTATTNMASTQDATTRVATTQVAGTQPATRQVGPATSVATSQPTTRATTVASATQPTTRRVDLSADLAKARSAGRWAETVARSAFAPSFEATSKALGGMEKLKTQLDDLEATRRAEKEKTIIAARIMEQQFKAEQARLQEARRQFEAARQQAERRIEQTIKVEARPVLAQIRKAEVEHIAEKARLADTMRKAKEAQMLALQARLQVLEADLPTPTLLKGSILTEAAAKRTELLDKAAAAVRAGTLTVIDDDYRASFRREYETWLRHDVQKRAGDLLVAAKESVGGINDPVAKIAAYSEVAVAQVEAGRPVEARETLNTARTLAGQLSKGARGLVYRDLARPLAIAGDVTVAKAMASTIARAAWKAEALRDIAAAQARAGRFDDAVATAASITESREQAEAYGLVAAAQAATGDTAAATAIIARIPKSSDQIGAYLNLADAEILAKNIPAARASLNDARKRVTDIDDAYFKTRALRWVIGAEARIGDITRAKAEAKSLDDPHEKALAYQSIAAAQVTTGQLTAVVQTLGDAEVAASAIRDARERDEVMRDIAVTQADAGNPALARRTSANIRDATALAVANRAIARSQARVGDLASATKTLSAMPESSEKALGYRAIAEDESKTGDEDKIAAFLATVSGPFEKTYAQIGSARAWIKLADEVAPKRE